MKLRKWMAWVLSFSILLGGGFRVPVNAGGELDIIWLPAGYHLFRYADIPANFSEGLALITNDGMGELFMNRVGRKINFARGSFLDSFKEGLTSIYKAEKENRIYGYINRNGKEVIPYQYEWADRFSEGLAAVKKDGKWGYIDQTGQEVIPYQYEGAYYFSEGLALIEKKDEARDEIAGAEAKIRNYKVAYIDRTGYQEIPFQYDFIQTFTARETGDYIGAFKEGLALVKKDEKYGYIDRTGRLVIPLQYDDWGGNFSEGLAVAAQNGKYGYIDRTGKEVIPFQYGQRPGNFHEGRAVVMEGGKLGYIDQTGQLIVPIRYDLTEENEASRDFSEGLAAVVQNGKYGYINQSGQVVIPFQFDWAGKFDQGVTLVAQNGKIGILRNPLTTNLPKTMAAYSRMTLMVNGRLTQGLEAYVINGNTYFKLRDIAQLAQESPKKFNVDWDGNKRLIALTRGRNYLANGSEFKPGDGTNKTASLSTVKLEIDGKAADLIAYTINGNNYFKLRDLAEALGFTVDWNKRTQMIEVEMK